MKTMILFYSRTRKTALIAKTLAHEINADYLEITDLNNRGGALNYLRASVDAFRENKTLIKPKTVDLTDYDLVYLGSPTWAGKPAPAIITLIDQCNFQGKDVVLFATMGNSGGKKVIERMREKIEPRGGRFIKSFLIKTGNKKSEELVEDVKKIVKEEDLTLYGI
ncbi:flavodoxin family protein [Methanobacterium formicicum]|jgi:flavodoxin|uniref:flavodoxin family protein n=1 Tax=Methanobacterium formicicum TaxID=2162 RepID=UPI002FE1790D